MDILDKYDKKVEQSKKSVKKQVDDKMKLKLKRIRKLSAVMGELSKLRQRNFVVHLDEQEVSWPSPNIMIKGNGKSLSIATDMEASKWLIGERLLEREISKVQSDEDLIEYVITKLVE